MKKRNILYIVIAIICVVAIIAGVYYEVFKKKPKTVPVANETEKTNEIVSDGQDSQEIVDEFNLLFDNAFHDQNYDTTSVKKITGHEEQELIYKAYDFSDEKDEKYSVNISLPVFNVDSEDAGEFNKTTQKVFVNKADEILTKSDKYTIYNVEYVGYLNDNILSLVIKSTLKEGNNAQRIIVQTYNYDIKTNKIITLNEVLNQKGINQKDVNKKIDTQVRKAAKDAEAIASATGQTVYERDINNAMYVTDNVNNFFVGKNGQIYIVYPYGNNNITSEIDIIKV